MVRTTRNLSGSTFYSVHNGQLLPELALLTSPRSTTFFSLFNNSFTESSGDFGGTGQESCDSGQARRPNLCFHLPSCLSDLVWQSKAVVVLAKKLGQQDADIECHSFLLLSLVVRSLRISLTFGVNMLSGSSRLCWVILELPTRVFSWRSASTCRLLFRSSRTVNGTLWLMIRRYLYKIAGVIANKGQYFTFHSGTGRIFRH